jgi:hypothetical protein
MASLHLTREVKAYVAIGTNWWEIPVLDGLSFSQGTNITEVTVAEMVDSTGASRRGRLAFNDSLNPAEWSFSTYAQPFIGKEGNGSAAEEVLWALMAGFKGTYTSASSATQAGTFSDVITKTASSMTVDFASSNVLEFQPASLYFKFPTNGDQPDIWYKIENMVVNEVTADFDLDGVTTLNWSGFGTFIDDVSSLSATLTASSALAVVEGLDQTGTFIRNRLTQLSLSSSQSTINLAGSYSLVLTGGSISISNNIEFITPSSLNVVNRPLGSVNGTRTVTGSFMCYLNNAADGSAELFEDIINASSEVQNQFDLTFKVGGTATPRVEFHVPQAMLEIPAHSVEDLVSVEVNFHGLPTNISAADEITVTYYGDAI